ncbi:MAG TPA: alkaline phosphatase family protein [Pseudolysinimonas sp.]|nr:alkaline phosphatase family protein [Pseudolysinimonas sp.]
MVDADNGQPPPDPTPAEQAGPIERPSRRGFLTGAVAGAAGVVAGAAGGYAVGSATSRGQVVTDPTVAPRPEGTGFDHLVVVMFENRSFDNLLGYLYEGPDGESTPAGQTFEGLQGDHSNPAPDGTRIPAHPHEGPTDEIMRKPDPDPGEEYPYVNTQLFGTIDPESNRSHDLPNLKAPFNAPRSDASPTMEGFVIDYVDKFRGEHHREPTVDEYRQIMGNFVPNMLPVFSTLARSFAIYDHWHCAVPSQTFPNRSFFHASSSHGFVTNGLGGYDKWLDPDRNQATTIFNRLQDAGVPWGVYYDDRQLISLTGLLHAPQLEPYWKTNFHTMSTFYEQAANGTLPAYAFIEPRMLYDHNDMHPPVGPITGIDVDQTELTGGISDVRSGDALLHEVYAAIRTSAASTGSNALNTVLLVTFDEHGGTYDHVPPPSATPPHAQKSTEMGFGFDRLGVRVPAMVVSAYTPAGTIINDEMHHGSLIATLCERYGLDPLTKRDDGATTLRNAVTLAQPRDPSTWPTTFPLFIPTNPESKDPIHDGQEDHPLSPPGVGLMSMLVARYGEPGEPVPHTYREAWASVRKHGQGLFGE